MAVAHGPFVEVRTLPDGEPALLLWAGATVFGLDISGEGELAAATSAGPIRRWALQDRE